MASATGIAKRNYASQLKLSLTGKQNIACTLAYWVKQLVEQDYLTQAHALVEFQPKFKLSNALGASLSHSLQDYPPVAILAQHQQLIHWSRHHAQVSLQLLCLPPTLIIWPSIRSLDHLTSTSSKAELGCRVLSLIGLATMRIVLTAQLVRVALSCCSLLLLTESSSKSLTYNKL